VTPSIESENHATGYLSLPDKQRVNDEGFAMSDLGPTDRQHDDAIEAAVDETDVDREKLVKQAIVAIAETESVDVPDKEEVDALRRDLTELDATVDEKISDLRDRFVELYRDIETKAPADHAHEETTGRLASIEADLDAVSSRLDDIDDRQASVESLANDIDDQQASVESLANDIGRLESRMDDRDVDELDDKLSRVASAVVRIRRRLEAAERDRTDREQLASLTDAANRHGVRKAKCGNCGETVDIGLLATPACPHCGSQFAELEPNPGFLGTSTLVVGDPPALDGDVGDAQSDADAAASGSADVSTRTDESRRS